MSLDSSPAGAGTNGATTYEADCTSALAGSQAAPFIEGLDVTATPDPSAATGATFGAAGTATQTIIGPVIAGLEQAIAPTAIGASTNETIGSTDGTATGSFAYSHTFGNQPAMGRQITGVTWASGSTTLTAAAGTFVAGDVGSFVAGTGINPESTIASVATDGSSAVLSQATTAAGTAATIGTGMDMTFTDPTFSTGNVFTTAGTAGGKANIGVVGVTGVTVDTNVLNVGFGGTLGVGTADCLLTGWQNSTTPGPPQMFETAPALPAGTTNPLVLANGGFVTQAGTTQAITPPPAAFVNLAPAATPLSVTTTTLPSGTEGQAYSATLAATGGTTPYTWSATGLPAGLTLDAATGAISGIPSTSGTSTVTVTVSDAASHSDTATLSLTVAPAATPLSVTTTTLPSGTEGQAYSATLAATGGTTPYTWSATGLPAGLTLDAATGAISGIPSTSGTSTVTVTVGDAASHTATATLSLTVAPATSTPLAVTTTRLPHCNIGHPYSATLSATGGTQPYTWSTPDPTDFPPGITLSSTGTISGTDSTQRGEFSFTVTATDASGATANAMLTLNCRGHEGHHGHHHGHGDDDDNSGNSGNGGNGGNNGMPRAMSWSHAHED